ncbi:MAG TPA: hypothetical protein VMI75_35705 [Polyangiaceae bacterium]|nr:hypothetical protein [Polyangiaceae bacterium]
MTRTTIHAVVAVALVCVSACNDPLTPTTHPLVGNAYDSADGCLQPQQSFDIVDGPAPSGTCDVVCITDAKTGVAYVTNACGPYPTADAVEGADAGGDTCGLALAAWAAGNECGATSDAGADAPADAPLDAPADTPADAPSDAMGDGG